MPTFVYQHLATMMRSRPLRWRSIVIKTAVFVPVVIALRLAFTTNAISSSLSYLPKPAVAKAYPSVPTDIELRPGAISMMVVGDSISQGGEGDWTWRYRLWEWLKSQEVTVDFVGPFIGTRPQAVPASFDEVIIPEPLGLPPTGSAITTAGYATDIDPEFNCRHFTSVGRTLNEDVGLIAAMVERYNPEYLLVLLGFNDLAWYPTTYGRDILMNMERFVEQARIAKTNIKFAIGNVPHRAPLAEDLTASSDAYNKLLAEVIPKWSTEISPIELVHVQENYSCEGGGCPAGHDGLHPNTLGDYQIAQAFSRALINGFKLGNTELVVPSPADLPVRPISIPKNFRAVAGAYGVNVTWDAFYGAKGYDVQSMVLGEQTWILWPSQQENRFRVVWTEAKMVEMEFKVRMSNGDQEKGEWSRVICTCRSWSSLTSQEKWDWRWWYRRLWACSWK